MPLTPKQETFVREWLIDFNGAQAAIRAGYSAKTAKAIASELLGKDEIAAAIKACMEARAKRLELSADRVVQEAVHLALAYLNMRSQLWWKMREALDPENSEPIALPPDRKLAAELAAPLWTLRSDRIQIESKDEMRKRLGSSTDRADAVMLAWHDRHLAVFRQKQRTNPAPQYAEEWDPYTVHDQGGFHRQQPIYSPDHDPFA